MTHTPTPKRVDPAPFDTYAEVEIVVRGRDGRDRIETQHGPKGKAKGRAELRIVTSVGYMGEKDRRRFAFQVARFVRGALEARSTKPIEEIVTEALRIADRGEADRQRRRAIVTGQYQPSPPDAGMSYAQRQTYNARAAQGYAPGSPNTVPEGPPPPSTNPSLYGAGNPCHTVTLQGQPAGWGCGECQTFNSAERRSCRSCGHTRCDLPTNEEHVSPDEEFVR